MFIVHFYCKDCFEIFILQPPSSIRSTPAATWSAAPRSKTTPSRPDPPAVASGYSPTQQEEEDKELKTSVSIWTWELLQGLSKSLRLLIMALLVHVCKG